MIDDPIFDLLRHRGFRGTPILRHRALTWQRIRPWTIAYALLSALLVDAALLWATPQLSLAWRSLLAFWLDPLATDSVVGTAARQVLPGWRVDLPVVTLGAGAPTGLQWLNSLLAGIALLLGSFLLPFRARPLAYLLRLIALVQFSANLYFYLVPGQFPYALREHVTTLFSGTCVMMLLVPWLLTLTYFPFDHRWWQKLGLMLGCLLYFAIFAPLWLALHAWAIHSASLVIQPVLYLIFGYPIQVFVFVCLYGWGMSWRA